jgi:hypothetical protein
VLSTSTCPDRSTPIVSVVAVISSERVSGTVRKREGEISEEKVVEMTQSRTTESATGGVAKQKERRGKGDESKRR